MGQFERSIAIFAVFCMVFSCTRGAIFLEAGIFEFDMEFANDGTSNYSLMAVEKSLFRNSEIAVKVVEVLECTSNSDFTIEWTIRQSYCDGIYRTMIETANSSAAYFKLMRTLYEFPQCLQMESELHVAYLKSVTWPNTPMPCESAEHFVFEGLHDLNETKWNCATADTTVAHCNKEVCPRKPAEPSASEQNTQKGEGESQGSPNAGSSDSTAPKHEANQGGGTGANGQNEGETPQNGDKAIGKMDDAPSQTSAKMEAKASNSDKNTKARRKRAGEQSPKEPGASGGEENSPKENKGDGTVEENEPSAAAAAPAQKKPINFRVLHTSDQDGRIAFIVSVTSKAHVKIRVQVSMKSPWGYLSATQYPLLPFYGVMCGIYSIMALVWMVLLFRQWKDLLRIQFCISAVIVLGLIEKAAFVAEYDRHNNTGRSTNTGIFIAEEISVLKRTLARMLVIIVSLGYGITRPRLGRDFNWVMGAGVLFFILSSVETIFRINGSNYNSTIALLPLSVLDALLCWWIFRSLVDTSRTLRLRRNVVKLWLYRHFTNALIFCVVAALIFLIWSVKMHRLNPCVHKWNELWLDDAYWHILFCVILFVIMILLRPTANNQRYAYSVLSDAVDDEDSKEPMMNDAFESVKMRNVQSNKSSSGHANKEQDDLQWVEDNIPAAVADAALAAFDDSEEELITNMERNKME